jgi:hypothetical protein
MSVLTAARRNKLPASTFAGPDRSYPIDTANRARDALSRASANAGPALKAQIRAKVHRKFPGIKQHDESRMKMDGGAVRHRMDRAPRKH